jgi:hypothetical protein
MRLDHHQVDGFAAAAIAFALVVGACDGSSAPSPATASPDGPAQRVSDVQGAFQLTFELPRTTFRAGEPIDGLATLGVIGDGAIAFGSSGGGPFVFDFAEIEGGRHVGGVMDGACAAYRLEPGRPMTSEITKSGAFSAEDPEAAFYRTFLSDPVVSLPAGDWRITAAAALVEGKGCSGASRNLAAPITVRVTP